MEFQRELSVRPLWNRFTAGLVAAMALARGLDFLSTWLVIPRLELEANPFMRRAGFIRMALAFGLKLRRNSKGRTGSIPGGGPRPRGNMARFH